jgi:Xaa-Pro aminopeptidase
LLAALETPAIIASGGLRSRNYPANTYPFRASSHFLYLIGASIPSAVLLLRDGRTTLFLEPEEVGADLWDGPKPSFDALRETHQLDAVEPLSSLEKVLEPLRSAVAALPTQDAASCRFLSACLGRELIPGSGASLKNGTTDANLANAMIGLRLSHDDDALAQLRWAADVTAHAHLAGMRATRLARSETEVFGAMMGVLRRAGHEDAYGPIVSKNGEVLHNVVHDNPIAPGDLLLADVGGETPEGWAGDITRVWPVSGSYSPTQRAIYDVVLQAEVAAVARVRAGVRYRDIHEAAKRAMVTGLRDLGIFRGDVDGLLERGAAAIFFPHGTGHLLGLDVHDMEDLGDRAGYAPGRSRSKAFGDCYLRLDRDLAPRMAVTIEPGFYQVPAILSDPEYTGAVGDDLRRDVLAKFSDVRGIRIEDDVVVTEGDPEILTSLVPKTASEVEEVVRSG